jgi:outer membrane protein OmpA-like peptidoglycan-associated protein
MARLARWRAGLLLAAGLAAGAWAQAQDPATDADPAAPALADAPATMARAEAAVARLGAERGRSLAAQVHVLAGQVSNIPGLASNVGAGARSLKATVADLEQAKRALSAQETELEVRIALPADVLFDVDSAAIRPDAAAALDGLATVIRGYSGPATLVGHTDADGSEAHNLDLSQRRAAAVRDWLVGAGIPATRLHTEGRGESEPVAANDTPANKQRNRRVDVVIAKQ